MSIGELARRTQVHLETIRYYEREGLMPEPRRLTSGHRSFDHSAIGRLRFIRHAQELGFSLAEIREILALRAHPDRQCTDVCRQTRQKLKEVNEKITHLLAIKRALARLARACSGDRRIRECGILEVLDRETES